MRITQISNKFLQWFLLICVALLSVHFKTGVSSGVGEINIIALGLRATLWFGALFICIFFIKPSLFFIKFSLLKANKVIVISSWPLFFFFTLVGTMATVISYGVNLSTRDLSEFVEVAGCFALVLVVYNISRLDPMFTKKILLILLFFPAVQVLGVLMVPEELAQKLGVNDHYDFVWYFGYGNRFVGLLGNANSVSVGACVSFGILFVYLVYGDKINLKLWPIIAITTTILYLFLIIGMILLTGSRASILSVLVMSLIVFSYSPVRHKFKLSIFALILSVMLIFYGVETGLFTIILERIGQQDGRVFIWRYYVEQLALNPLGYGLAFENVIDVTKVKAFGVDSVRLPPHNVILEVGVYSGLLGIFLTIVSLISMTKIMKPLLRAPAYGLNIWYKGACVAWVGLLTNYFFGSLIFGSWYFSILTGVILSAKALIKKE